MGKFLAELALFAVILFQINLLVNKAGDNDGAAAAQPVAALAQSAPLLLADAGLPTSGKMASMKSYAKAEAERIVATGDVSSLQNSVTNNAIMMQFMGYD